MKIWQDYKLENVGDLLKLVHKDNPRRITQEAKDKLKTSLDSYGMLEPIIINDETGRILSGHQRLSILSESEIKEVMTLHISVDEATEYEILLALNNAEMTGTFVNSKVSDIINKILDKKPETTFTRSNEGLITNLISQGQKINLNSILKKDEEEKLIDRILTKAEPAKIDGSVKTFDDAPEDYFEDDEDDDDYEETSKTKYTEEDDETYIEDEPRESKIKNVQADQLKANNQKFLKLGVNQNQLDIILRAYEQTPSSAIPEYLRSEDPVGSFITWCVSFTMAHNSNLTVVEDD